MNVIEIGSEYHYITQGGKECTEQLKINAQDYAYVFSGRTAIETILKNLHFVKRAMLPSYCCDSMIEPFRRAGIEISFYKVSFDGTLRFDIDISNGVDLILWCNYFGFENSMPDFSAFKSRGGVILEDISHSVLSTKQYNEQSDYIVASLRKWFPLLCGGYCASINGKLTHKPQSDVPDEFLKMRKSAMQKKAQYLANGDRDLKEQFLQEFANGNSWLAVNYSNLKIDEESFEILNSINMVEVTSKRRRNAKLIYERLKNQNSLVPIFKEGDMECPLFVPVFCESEDELNRIKQKLIDNNVFCPCHWPKPKSGAASNLYCKELSLICDQRYDEDDIYRMMSIICDA